jgi:galactokinase
MGKADTAVTMDPLRTQVIDAFTREFGGRPTFIARAPGRVNLIGEHTDYNGGFVLPLAIDRAAWIAFRPRDDGRIRVHSLSFGDIVEFEVVSLAPGGASGHWSEYVKGTAWSLRDARLAVGGWDGVLGSDVPIGAGLSSSAAIELATARACAAAGDLPWDAKQMALRGQRAENVWVGVNCGIMDQLISAAAVEGAALLIDCRTLDTTPVPLPQATRVVVLDTATRRGLVDSAYNERRAQCELAARTLGVPLLRDATLDALRAHEPALDAVAFRRARHVITEDLRTEQAADIARAGDAVALGRLIDASHASLRDDFEVSSAALDTMVECARRQPGCLGSRMTGAGFGGCALALVEAPHVEAFVAGVTRDYARATSLTPSVYACRASAGASVEQVR